MDEQGQLREEMARLMGSLRRPGVVYFPLRHHSPACALQLRTLLQTERPRAILIEAPTVFEPLIPRLLDARTHPPVSLYTTFTDRRGRLARAPVGGPQDRELAPRFAAHYPFADYSPEWVALKTGAELGAELRFIDLDFASQVLVEQSSPTLPTPAGTRSLQRERHLRGSKRISTLAMRCGCRDFDELWDHLFESRALAQDPMDFASNLAAWCWMARQDYDQAQLAADGTLARERHMAAHIRRALDSPPRGRGGPVIVITGGFHTIALPGLVDALTEGNAPTEDTAQEFGEDETGHYLIRHGFEALDALNGYGSGMPSPQFHQKIWEAALDTQTPGDSPWDSVAATLIVDLGRVLRREGRSAACSTADAIAALQQARLLARLRGHPGPLRSDIIDAVTTCLGKGMSGPERAPLTLAINRLMTGTATGEVPPGTGVPPIVDDFHQLAREHRLETRGSSRRKLALELYRSVRHRRASRFLHRTEFLGIPFGRLLDGPDFARGRDTARMAEHWDIGWSPRTDGALIEAASDGTTIEEAVLRRLHRQVDALRNDHADQGTALPAVAILEKACRLGLHTASDPLVEMIREGLETEVSFARTVRAAEQLTLLWRAREPLEARLVPGLEALARAALMRASSLTQGLATCPGQEADEALQSLVSFCALHSAEETLGDAALAGDCLMRLHSEQNCNPLLAGACLGLLNTLGRATEPEIARECQGRLAPAGGPWEVRVDFLRGLLTTRRELAWQSEELVRAIDTMLAGCEEDTFLATLPSLRLAFSSLTPREAARVGDVVSSLHDGADMGPLHGSFITEDELLANAATTRTVLALLREDGLGEWAEAFSARTAVPNQVTHTGETIP